MSDIRPTNRVVRVPFESDQLVELDGEGPDGEDAAVVPPGELRGAGGEGARDLERLAPAPSIADRGQGDQLARVVAGVARVAAELAGAAARTNVQRVRRNPL